MEQLMVGPYKLILLVGFMSISTLLNAQNKIAFECFNNDVITNLKSDSYCKSFGEIKKQEKYHLFFSSKKGRQVMKKLYGYFREFKLGLWIEKNHEVFFNNEEEGLATIKIVTTIERNLTLEQQKKIKKKVSRKSYKNAKYHQLGEKVFVFYFEVIEGVIYIVGSEVINSLKIVR